MTGNLNASGKPATAASGYLSQVLQASGGGVIDPTTLLTNVEAASNAGVPLFSTAPGSNVLTLSGVTKGTIADPVPTASFTVTPTSTVGDLLSFYNSSMGIDTSVAGPPVPGAAVDPTGSMITITGNAGTANSLQMGVASLKDAAQFSPLAMSPDPTAKANGESVQTTAVAYDSLGQQVTLHINAVMESVNPTGGTSWRFYVTSPDNAAGNLTVGNGTLDFDGSGQLTKTTGGLITLDRTGSGANTSLPITIDFSGISALGQKTSTIKENNQDGSSAGTLTDFSIGTDGTIIGAYSNGLNKTLGQVVLAKFNNPEGLTDEGGNLYSAGSNSGIPVIASAGSLGMGDIRGQSLELSNVDLSNEFINLIVASTGFTAASRVITTSNQLLTELLNTSR